MKNRYHSLFPKKKSRKKNFSRSDYAQKSLEKSEKRLQGNRLSAARVRARKRALMEIMCEAGLVIPEVTYESAEISEATQELQSMPPGQIKAKNCIKAKRSRAKRALFFDACRNALAAQSDEQKSELELKIDERKKSNYQKYSDRGLIE